MRQCQRGVAVIVALLIVTLAASTAAFAVWQQSLWVRQLENIGDRARADQLAAGAIEFARVMLKNDKDKAVDSLDEPWAGVLALPVDNASLTGQITDQQSRFNLNNLVKNNAISEGDMKAFAQLLESLKLPVELAGAVANWIRVDESGMTDLYYLSLNPPYRAAQRPLVDVAELARIKGFNEDIVRALAPYVTAVDSGSPVNVNTASAEVLSAVLVGLSASDAKANLIKKRETAPFKTKAEVKKALATTVICHPPAAPDACYDVKSSYFTATARVKSGRVESGYTALLKRAETGWPVILWRKDATD